MVLGLTQDTRAMIIIVIIAIMFIKMMQIHLILFDIYEIELIGIILQKSSDPLPSKISSNNANKALFFWALWTPELG